MGTGARNHDGRRGEARDALDALHTFTLRHPKRNARHKAGHDVDVVTRAVLGRQLIAILPHAAVPATNPVTHRDRTAAIDPAAPTGVAFAPAVGSIRKAAAAASAAN